MAASTTTRVKILEPATEGTLAELPEAEIEDVERAIARAKAAFPGWRAVTPGDRAALMRRLADAIADQRDELATLEARNVGKPIADARGEMGAVVDLFHYMAAAPERLFGKTIPVAGGVDMTFREPLGVVGLITPWNYPLWLASTKVAPALAAGNAGQDCCARSRILVERPALDRFMEVFEKAVTALRVGDPLDEQTQMGPLISADQRQTVASYVEDGAPVAFRGSAPQGRGYWFPPTVLCPVSNDDRVAREEVFGPVAAVIPFEDEEEAVRIANDTVYGLSGSIWTRDGARALRVARAIQTGTISINSNTSVRVTTPFGGFKQSGLGRELGPHALEHYTELKNVYMATG